MDSDYAARGTSTDRRPRHPLQWVRRRVGLAALVVGSGLLLSGCAEVDWDQVKRLAQPESASDRADPMFDFWIGSWIAAFAVGFLVWGLIIWCIVRYRRRSDDDVPTQTEYHLPIEVLYTIAPLIIVAVFFFHSVQTQDKVLEVVDNPDHEITVVAQKWAWTFNYEHEDSVGGETVYDVGAPDQFSELWLPVDETVTFNLRSPDVIHSFWVPEFLFKMDVIPGRENSFSLTPTREGVFEGRCAELCGTYHSRMLFDVHIVSSDEYDAHLAELQAAGQVGGAYGNSYTDDIAGIDEEGAEQ
ncbi:MAG TPA: cytochrome c oxidase subunit II [Nocardioidaceae bacterium]|nr:cytochrome c oxidase subunit II [Nocardioidaceae bacterium]